MDGLGPFQTANFTCAESNANETSLFPQSSTFETDLIEKKPNLFANVGKARTACTLNSRLNLKTKEHCGSFWEKPDKFCCENVSSGENNFTLKM